jgi:hypothetical protein
LSYIFFKIIPLLQLYTSASDCKCVENISGNHFKTIRPFCSILNDDSSIKRAPPLQFLISVEGQIKISCSQVRRVCAPVVSHCSWLRHFLPKSTGVLEHCREGKSLQFLPYGRSIGSWICLTHKTYTCHTYRI